MVGMVLVFFFNDNFLPATIIWASSDLLNRETTLYSKTCLKRALKNRHNKDLTYKW